MNDSTNYFLHTIKNSWLYLTDNKDNLEEKFVEILHYIEKAIALEIHSNPNNLRNNIDVIGSLIMEFEKKSEKNLNQVNLSQSQIYFLEKLIIHGESRQSIREDEIINIVLRLLRIIHIEEKQFHFKSFLIKLIIKYAKLSDEVEKDLIICLENLIQLQQKDNYSLKFNNRERLVIKNEIIKIFTK